METNVEIDKWAGLGENVAAVRIEFRNLKQILTGRGYSPDVAGYMVGTARAINRLASLKGLVDEKWRYRTEQHYREIALTVISNNKDDTEWLTNFFHLDSGV